MRRSKKLRRRMAGRSILLVLKVFLKCLAVVIANGCCCCRCRCHCCCRCQRSLQSGLVQVDLLLCCGDFQSTRNLSDLACMACPDKYKEMCSFYKYYRCVETQDGRKSGNFFPSVPSKQFSLITLCQCFSGEAIAPLLTIFIGGNHEATNYLQVPKLQIELGW